ncbi:phosphatase PAP2 family protein [Natronococcus wangiae]|uniref:phosphatase PAP2 family protein n=1 Tax=Natronococcus wangiae TaxID=3068275 RepID=UPI002740155F|nr:phosphatase PAP2 family protein [Natronococcus sp. AD5]
MVVVTGAGVLLLLVLVVGVLLVLTSALCDVDPFWLTLDDARARAREIVPYVGILGIVYLFNRSSHAVGQRLSAAIGLDITGTLHALEGNFVADLQGAFPYEFAEYFSFVYLFGFAFTLAFPVVAYFVLPSQRYLKELFVAYAVNYGAGAACYVLFIAYGPRNVIATVREPMFELYPQVVAITAAVNSSANVFPSLHASLTVTVWLMAWRTRDEYPLWPWISTFTVVNIIASTMFLGIHWLIDVIAGIGLAVISVAVALRVTARESATGGP